MRCFSDMGPIEKFLKHGSIEKFLRCGSHGEVPQTRISLRIFSDVNSTEKFCRYGYHWDAPQIWIPLRSSSDKDLIENFYRCGSHGEASTDNFLFSITSRYHSSPFATHCLYHAPHYPKTSEQHSSACGLTRSSVQLSLLTCFLNSAIVPVLSLMMLPHPGPKPKITSPFTAPDAPQFSLTSAFVGFPVPSWSHQCMHPWLSVAFFILLAKPKAQSHSR